MTDKYEYEMANESYADVALNQVKSNDGLHIIELCREIVRDFSMKTIDGVIMDVQTANAIVTVYDNIDDSRKQKLINSNNVAKIGEIAWKVLAK